MHDHVFSNFVEKLYGFAEKLYGDVDFVEERHRHRYEVLSLWCHDLSVVMSLYYYLVSCKSSLYM